MTRIAFNAPQGNVIPLRPRFSAGQPPMAGKDDLAKRLGQMEYRDGYRLLAHDEDGKLFAQVQYDAPDVGMHDSKPGNRDGTTWWPIPRDFNIGKIYQRMMLALFSVEDHELRENFRYKGLKIFNPHFKMLNMINWLVARQNKPTLPDTVHTDTPSVQALLNDCKIMGYGFKLEKLIPIDTTKEVLVVQIVDDPQNPITPITVAHDLKDKKLTFLTGNTSGKILRSLMDAIITEQKEEVKFQFKVDGFAPFSKDVPISHIVEYAQERFDLHQAELARQAGTPPTQP